MSQSCSHQFQLQLVNVQVIDVVDHGWLSVLSNTCKLQDADGSELDMIGWYSSLAFLMPE